MISDDDSLARIEDMVTSRLRVWLPAGATMTSVPLAGAGMRRLDITAPSEGSAGITVFLAATETILEAGLGTRFELDPVPTCLPELTELTQSIVQGRLVESISIDRVDFELVLSDGRVVTGGQMQGLFRRRKLTSRLTYLPYAR